MLEERHCAPESKTSPTRRQSQRSHRSRLALVFLGALWQTSAQETGTKKTFVIVHGAWGGGWDWRTVSDLLTSRGSVVFRPTLTGLGERAHLASPDIGETHITDVVNTILYENLRDVMLVGHRYGGMIITGVADRIPERIAHLAYVDAFIPESGESVADLAAKQGSSRPPDELQGGFVVPRWVRGGTPPPTDVPQAAKTFTDPIVLKRELRARISSTYILTVDRGAETDAFDVFAARAKTKGWRVERLTADHNPQRSAPKELSTLLEQLR